MWPEPDDPATIERMRAAHTHARRIVHAAFAPDSTEKWGWQGRTLGRHVTTPTGPAWLKIAATPADHIIGTFWNGAVQAQQSLPSSIPRPTLHRWHDWSHGQWAYRGELHEYVPAGTVASHAAITNPPNLPATWWTALRATLDTITAVPTSRLTVQPGFLAWAMPHYLGISSEHSTAAWTTAHGDLHFANMCSPQLHILDWEGWGLAPPGYDAATLHTYSLLSPPTAAQIDRELAHLLNTSTGRYAELAVISELLDAADNGANGALTDPLRRRATTILETSTRVGHPDDG